MGQLDTSIHLDTIQIYEIAMTAEFADWLGGLPDPAVKLRVLGPGIGCISQERVEP